MSSAMMAYVYRQTALHAQTPTLLIRDVGSSQTGVALDTGSSSRRALRSLNGVRRTGRAPLT
jgi:hypothetical protein